MKISQQLLEQLNKDFLGKRVSIENKEGKRFVGTLDFLGYNTFFPKWELCATIDRTPMQYVKVESIKLSPFPNSLFKKINDGE